MAKIVFLSIFLLSFGILISNCQFNNSSINISDAPHQKLSEYQFFKGNLADLQPNERVIPYDLNSSLFTNYAHKARFVWMPEGTSAQYTTDQVLDFPEGTALIKNFYYENDETDTTKGIRLIETRLLINKGNEWEAISYIWNDEQTEAYHEVIGDIKAINWVDKKGKNQAINYIIPNKNQCKSCHLNGENQVPIGPKTRNLNKKFAYVDGEMNQLEKWANIGYLAGYDAKKNHPKMANWNKEISGNLQERALAYLDINCTHCHHQNGTANISWLNYPVDGSLELNAGIYQQSIATVADTDGHNYRIVRGHPEKSMLLYRMKSMNPGAMMPEVGRSVIHTEGINLISAWIKNMEVE